MRHPTAARVFRWVLIVGLTFGGWWFLSNDPEPITWAGVPIGIVFWAVGVALGWPFAAMELRIRRPGEKTPWWESGILLWIVIPSLVGFVVFLRMAGAPYWAAAAMGLGGLMLAGEVAEAFRPRLDQERRHPSGGSEVEHNVEIWDVRPFTANDFEPYFTARCECGWVAEAKPTEYEARVQAKSHSRHINQGVQRPLA